MRKLGSLLAAVLVVALSPPAHAQTTGSSWLMDETSGTVMVDSTGSNNGATHNVTLRQPGRPGDAGASSYGFDGTSSYVVVPNSPSLSPGTQDISFTAWVDLAGTPGIGTTDYDIIRKGSGWKMEMFPHGGVADAQCVYAGKVGGTAVKVNIHAPQQNGVGLDDHAWHVVTCTRNASGETLTVDGSVVAQSSVQVGSITNTDAVFIGAQEKGIDFYDGLMDDVSVTIGTASGPPPPKITSFTPTSGAAGTAVTIAGSGFTGATDVQFHGMSVGAGHFTVGSDVQITATVPTGATTGPITVAAPGGSVTSSGSFTVNAGAPSPTITSFTPTLGGAGTTVTINGTNFTAGAVVMFNGLTASGFVFKSASRVKADVPTGATTGPISVTTAAGTATSSTPFTVPPPPTITSFTPTSGPVGTVVLITGTNFTGATQVKFGGVVATFTVNSATTITATVPAGAITGKIIVKAPGGSSSSPTKFTVV
jgi:hypothetical protein